MFAQFVAVAGGGAAVVGRAIALNAGQIAPGKVRVDDAQIDAERGRANLRVYAPAFALQRCGHAGFKRAVKVALAAVVRIDQRFGAALGELQKVLQITHTIGLGARQIQLVTAQTGEHAQLVARAGDGDVQAALAAVAVQGAKVHRHRAGNVGAVGDREIHDVALVALHAF